jgi:hypothetical protein
MIRCNNCGTNNIDGSEYCDECGMRLDLVPPARGRQPNYRPPSAVETDASDPNEAPPIAPPSFTTSTSVPKPAMPARDRKPESRNDHGADNQASKRRNMTDERAAYSPKPVDKPAEPSRQKPANDAARPQTFALTSNEKADALAPDMGNSALMENPRVTARLLIERGGRVGREFAISGIETNIGRWDADSGIFPDIDLDEDDPEAKISRRHARIIHHNGQYFIEDLGSTNGTFVNRGRRLLPGKRHMLQNGDEIIVGKTFLKFQILR